MKLKRLIRYVLNKASVPSSFIAGTKVKNISLTSKAGVIGFSAATAGSATAAYLYDNTVDFKVTVSGATARNAVIYMTSSTKTYTIPTDMNGEVHVHVLDGPYKYAVYATSAGITSATGVFTASTTGTISVAV